MLVVDLYLTAPGILVHSWAPAVLGPVQRFMFSCFYMGGIPLGSLESSKKTREKVDWLL